LAVIAPKSIGVHAEVVRLHRVAPRGTLSKR